MGTHVLQNSWKRSVYVGVIKVLSRVPGRLCAVIREHGLPSPAVVSFAECVGPLADGCLVSSDGTVIPI